MTPLEQGLMQSMDVFNMLVDTAAGLRSRMEESGFSPTASEQAAIAWLTNVLSTPAGAA